MTTAWQVILEMAVDDHMIATNSMHNNADTTSYLSIYTLEIYFVSLASNCLCQEGLRLNDVLSAIYVIEQDRNLFAKMLLRFEFHFKYTMVKNTYT